MTDLLARLRDGKQHEISQAEYDYFLEGLPPACTTTQFMGKGWDYGYAEAADLVYLFRRQGARCFAVRTPYLNPYEAGGFEIQKRRWILKWIELAKRDPTFRAAGGPRIDTQTFHEYATDEDLLVDVKFGGLRGGHALIVGNLCFVKLDSDSEEWLAMTDKKVLGRMSFRILFEAGNPEAPQQYLDALRAAGHETKTIGQLRRSR